MSLYLTKAYWFQLFQKFSAVPTPSFILPRDATRGRKELGAQFFGVQLVARLFLIDLF
jgi:hypothetical protein